LFRKRFLGRKKRKKTGSLKELSFGPARKVGGTETLFLRKGDHHPGFGGPGCKKSSWREEQGQDLNRHLPGKKAHHGEPGWFLYRPLETYSTNRGVPKKGGGPAGRGGLRIA